MSYSRITLSLLAFLFTSQLAAQGFQGISRLFNDKSYSEVLTALKNYNPIDKAALAEKYYFQGISESRLEQFDPAAKSLKKSISLGSKRKDIYYEVGQALYGNNDLLEAQKYFSFSAKKGFKPAVSLYYVAYSNQILEDYQKSKKYYSKMLQEPTITNEFKQIAHYQLAEILLELAMKKDNTKELVKKFILPRYDIGYQVNTKSDLAKDIQARKIEVMRRYMLDPNQLVSGKMFPTKRHRLSLSQAFKYDNNITLTTNQPTVQDTKKDSYIYETNAGGSYNFLFAQRYILTPELKVKYVKHSDRENPSVYEDDRYEIKPALKNRLDHKIGKKAASFNFDYKWNYSARDKYQQKTLGKYSTGSTWSIGEKVGFFRFGDSGLSYSNGNTRYYNPDLDFDLTSWTVTQTVIRPSGSLFLLMANVSQSRFLTATSGDSDTTMLRVDYILPKLTNQYSLHIGFSVTFLTVLATEATVGTDKTFAPSIKLTKAIRPNLKMSVNYDYSKKISNAGESSEYTKHVTGFELSANF